jgi:GH25 family lysozyme M1 (1,4-beta-N-acetylmuramidase)
MNIFKRQYWQNNLLYGEARRQRGISRPYMSAVSLPNTFDVWGVDVSHWNLPPVDFKRMKDVYGLSFAIIKGCDGSINSRYYVENKAAAKSAGVPWGMYVWLYPNNKVSIDAQVNAWHARYIADPPPLGIFIDAEWTYYSGMAAHPRATDLRMAHDKWFIKSGIKATTYTAAGYADTYLHGFDWSREELWIANYGVAIPLLPIGASKYTFWQFTSTLDGKALDPEGNAELDGNYFVGDHYEFQSRLTGEVEQTMNQWYRINTAVLNMRSGPGASYQDVGDFLAGDKIETAQNLGGWLEVVRYIRTNGSTGEPIPHVWCKDSYCVAIEPPIVTPDPEPADTITVNVEATITATINGRTYTGVAVIEGLELE